MKKVIISIFIVVFLAVVGVCVYFGVTKTPVEDVLNPGQQTEQPSDKPGTSTSGGSTSGDSTTDNGELKISFDQDYILFS